MGRAARRSLILARRTLRRAIGRGVGLSMVVLLGALLYLPIAFENIDEMRARLVESAISEAAVSAPNSAPPNAVQSLSLAELDRIDHLVAERRSRALAASLLVAFLALAHLGAVIEIGRREARKVEGWIQRMNEDLKAAQRQEFPYTDDTPLRRRRARDDAVRSLEHSLREVELRFARVRRSRDELRALSITDPLTRLPNRRGLETALCQWLAGPHSVEVVTAMHLDLDHFKAVNDTLGHEAGDHVLEVTAARMGQCVRDGDMISRVGGDEFVVILPELDDLGQLAQIAMRLIKAISEPIDYDGRIAKIGVSIGIAMGGSAREIEDAEELLRNADLAAFKSKANGRGRFSVFDQRMKSYIEHQRSMATRLTAALEGNDIEAWVQPVMSVDGRQILSVEALARWRDPGLGIVSAEDFIEIAKQRNLITDIGTVVIAHASQAVAGWRAAGFDIPQLSFNLSHPELQSPDLVDQVKWALERSELDPSLVAIEIPADIVDARGSEMMIGQIDRLRGLGIQVIADDADFDRPSLSDINRLGAKAVKLNRSIIDGIIGAEPDLDSLSRQIGFFRSLEAEVIGKGVISADVADMMRECGCTGLQGMHVGAPMSLHKFGNYLVARRLESLPLKTGT